MGEHKSLTLLKKKKKSNLVKTNNKKNKIAQPSLHHVTQSETVYVWVLVCYTFSKSNHAAKTIDPASGGHFNVFY